MFRSSSLRRMCVASAATACAVVVFVPASASAQATRTWVSQSTSGAPGDDANPCSRTAPCRTFAGAISKTIDSGEISVIDPGGYGTINITKGIFLDGRGTLASILATGFSYGILVNAPGKDVAIDNLDINGAGSPGTTCGTGVNGIRILAADTVTIRNTSIHSFTKAGISVEPTAGNVKVILDRVDIRDTCEHGIRLAPTGDATADLVATDSTISGIFNEAALPADQKGTGVEVNTATAGNATVGLHDTVIYNTFLGLAPIGSGLIDDLGGNALRSNTTDGAFTGPPVPPPTTVTVTQTVTAPPTTVTVPGPTVAATFPACTVPALKGLTRTVATTRLKKAGCVLGTVTTRRTSKRSQVGRVLSQKSGAGKQTKTGTKVAVVLGR